jgi:hypothetical protein
MICGTPRSGTALLTAMLFQPPRVVTVMEPWDALRLPPNELYESLKRELSLGTLRRGRLNVDELRRSGTVSWCRDGERSAQVDFRPSTRLGVKFPAFWQYLPLFPETKFLVCVRSPFDVVASFAQVGGRLAEGLDYDVPFNREMNEDLMARTSDPGLRRVLLYDYINSRLMPFLERPNVWVVRYERWFTEPVDQLDDIGAFLGVDLSTPLPRLQRPKPSAGQEESERVRAHCATAPALGYALESWS